MNVKGTAFLARKKLLENELGEAAAKDAIDAVVAAVPGFPQPVLASTPIPISVFLSFQDELVRRCYSGDNMSFFRFGEASADWALTKGPYKRLTEDKDLDGFATQGAALYRTYFDVGNATTSMKDGYVEFKIDNLPAALRHLYIEYATIGYFKRGMELLGASQVDARRRRGFSTGDADVHYELHFRREKPSSRRKVGT
ncbi:MAG: hypothetical protein ABI551_02990 [Polyangiaceae bacterium]